MNKIIKIAIADDEILFRQGISFILNKEVNFDIVMQAADGEDLLTQLENAEVLPEIILMDLKMPNLNGVETTKLIKKQYQDIKIIAITSYYSKPFISNMIATGAVAYLAKNTPPKEVVSTVNAVADKGFCYNDNVMQVIQENMLNPDAKTTRSYFDLDYLTKRESEVLKLICNQKTTNEIAEELFISPRTVEGHRNNLLLKTESKNVAGLVVFAFQHKIVSLEETFN
ncbi:response regulator [Pseudofulvibacter geojedonensis]|uniref:Response regulator n=1 Tax=Pseudofulvibacter geojedonensis TaxID=1123758 RepID=A0ABW3I4D1_9FLAO